MYIDDENPKVYGKLLQIAVYGKGGIGKSTTSANITYGLAHNDGVKVLQIGCDPKHDSTRSLLHGSKQPTVLEALDIKSSTPRKLSDLMAVSDCGAYCIECGGPEPGIGCAGRGIISAMNELQRCGLKKEDYDVILYDVLGDVVCGGFAVPLRKEYADVIYLVTSGEFMSLYAANNIIRGIRNHTTKAPRIGGIILNCRGVEDELLLVKRFSECVGVPIISTIPRDPLFAVAEKEDKPVMELFPDSKPSSEYKRIIENIKGHFDGSSACYEANPLSDEELDRLLKGKEVIRDGDRACSKTRVKPSDGEACAARAVTMTLNAVKGLHIVIHGPRACGYNMSNIRDVHFLADVKIDSGMDMSYKDNIVCTDMDDNDSIFGGIEKLESTMERLCQKGIREIAVITACIPGIIGDDVGSCIDRFRNKYPDGTFIDARADGNLTGTAFDGIRLARQALINLVDRHVVPEDNVVNIITGGGMSSVSDRNRIIELFGCIGLRVNAFLFSDCTIDEIKNARRAHICYPVSRREMSPQYRELFGSCGLEIADSVIPSGVVDTLKWLDAKKNLENADGIDKYVEGKMAAYSERVESSKASLAGKRIFIAGWLDRPQDWVADALIDAGATIIGAVSMGPISGNPFHSGRHTDVVVLEKTDSGSVLEFIEQVKPDLVLGNIRGDGMNHSFKNCGLPPVSIGFDASISLLDHVCCAMKAPINAGWSRGCGCR